MNDESDVFVLALMLVRRRHPVGFPAVRECVTDARLFLDPELRGISDVTAHEIALELMALQTPL